MDEDSLRGEGFAELSLKRYDAAIAHLTAAVALNPKDAPAYHFRALAHAGKNENKLALADLDVVDRLGGAPPQK